MPRPSVSYTIANPAKFGREVLRLVKAHQSGSVRAAAAVVGVTPAALAAIIAGKRTRLRPRTLKGVFLLAGALVRLAERGRTPRRRFRSGFALRRSLPELERAYHSRPPLAADVQTKRQARRKRTA